MQRTQLYLTAEQRRRLDQRAADAGVPMAEVVRRILDQALAIDDGAQARLAAVTATSGVLADADNWPDWLARVRGRTAAKRLEGRPLRST